MITNPEHVYTIKLNEAQRRIIMKSMTGTRNEDMNKETGSSNIDASTEQEEHVDLIAMFGTLIDADEPPVIHDFTA